MRCGRRLSVGGEYNLELTNTTYLVCSKLKNDIAGHLFCILTDNALTTREFRDPISNRLANYLLQYSNPFASPALKHTDPCNIASGVPFSFALTIGSIQCGTAL